jgi:hypothetical protein
MDYLPIREAGRNWHFLAIHRMAQGRKMSAIADAAFFTFLLRMRMVILY